MEIVDDDLAVLTIVVLECGVVVVDVNVVEFRLLLLPSLLRMLPT